MPSKEIESIHTPLESLENTNFVSKNILVDTHQTLSVDSVKSLENSFEAAVAIGNSRDSNNGSPLRSRRSITNSGIFELLWPQPKCIIELGHVSPPFIVSKELFISIIQVRLTINFC